MEPGIFNLKLEVILTLAGFGLTAAAIIWRGGRLEQKLSDLGRRVDALTGFQDRVFESEKSTAANVAAMQERLTQCLTRVDHVETRLASVEATCRERSTGCGPTDR